MSIIELRKTLSVVVGPEGIKRDMGYFIYGKQQIIRPLMRISTYLIVKQRLKYCQTYDQSDARAFIVINITLK